MRTLLYLLLLLLNAFTLGVEATVNMHGIENVPTYKFCLHVFFIFYFSIVLITHLKNPTDNDR